MSKKQEDKIRQAVIPTEDELKEFGLTVRNGVELQLGKQDPLIRIADRIGLIWLYFVTIQTGLNNFYKQRNK
jgi:hypothetical protein